MARGVRVARGGSRGRRLPPSLDRLAVFAVFGLLMVIPSGVTRLASSDTVSTAGLRGTVSVLEIRGPSDRQFHQVWVWRPPGPDSATDNWRQAAADAGSGWTLGS
jgi:hypothetical protein